MSSNLGYIMTMSNSIIGVSILAMPYCFKQCGIILAIVMLIMSNLISRLTCHFLLKSALMSRRRTFELLAFHIFGTSGKFMVELGIIGFLMGTCIAFFVIIGDLGPAIIAKILNVNHTDVLRTYILIGVALFCVLPLGLLKNVDSLNSVSTVTIGFYFCLVIKTVSESALHFERGDWLSRVEMWQPDGILQCLPIFAMAMSCQTQLFEIYETLPNASLEKMNYIVRIAVNICVCVYIFVGFFGYVAFATKPFTGNILMSFSPSLATDVMKIGFVLSVAFSFPLVIFPCRASLYSLLFKKGHMYEAMNNFIPESRFKILTISIVSVSLVIGLLIPNIEVVLGLVGSTIGTLICIIFPVTCFICISTKNTNERLLAQFLLFLGIIIMVMGTYRNLYAMDEGSFPVTEKTKLEHKVIDVKKIIAADMYKMKIEDKIIGELNIQNDKIVVDKAMPGLIRLEPPQPVEPVEKIVLNTAEIFKKSDLDKVKPQTESAIVNPAETIKADQEKLNLNMKFDVEKQANDKNVEEVDQEAIRKEDKELLEEEKDKQKAEKKELLETLQNHKIEQEKLVIEQKRLLKEQKETLAKIKAENRKLKETEIENKILKPKPDDKLLDKNDVNEEINNIKGVPLALSLYKMINKTNETIKKEPIANQNELDNSPNLLNKLEIEVSKDLKNNLSNLQKSNVTIDIQNKIEENHKALPSVLKTLLRDDKNNIAKSKAESPPKAEQLEEKPHERNILSNDEFARSKRETKNGKTLDINNNCEIKDKTESPLINLITELSNRKDLFKLDDKNMIDGIKSIIKSNTFVMRRK